MNRHAFWLRLSQTLLVTVSLLLLLTGRAEAAPTAIRTVGPGCTHPTLQAAVTAAVSGDEIRIQVGTYFGQTLINGKNLTISGGWNHDCSRRQVARSVLDGNNSGSVLEIFGNATVTLAHLELTGGTNDPDFGGGLEIDGGSVTLDNTLIYGNSSLLGGGVNVSAATLTLSNGSRIYDNSASSNGGGIYSANVAHVILQGGTEVGGAAPADGNTAVNGAGIYVLNDGLYSATVALNGTAAVRHNVASGNGGGLALEGGTLTDSADSVISHNSAGNGGGGIDAHGTEMTLLGTVSDNTATLDGGGIGGTIYSLTLEGATLARNSAGRNGGAVYGGDSVITVRGSSVIGGATDADANIATTHGGGLYCYATNCTLTEDALIKHNRATGGYGGGIYAFASNTALHANAQIAANYAFARGGGIYIRQDSILQIDGSTQIGGTDAADGNSVDPTNGEGGGIFAEGAGVTLAGDVQVRFNQAATGAGVYAKAIGLTLANNVLVADNSGSVAAGMLLSDSFVTLQDNVQVARNSAQYVGGLYITGGAQVTLQDAALIGGTSPADGNIATVGYGGGAFVDSATLYIIEPAQLRFNSAATNGGGVYTAGMADLLGIGGQILDNSADQGGGIYLSADTDLAQLDNVHVARNSARRGGGVYVAGGRLDMIQAAPCVAGLLPANTYCSELRDNAATERGSAVYSVGASLLNLHLTAIRGHNNGLAAIFVDTGAVPTLSMYNTLIADNGVTGIRTVPGANLNWQHVTFANNGGRPFLLSGIGTLSALNTIAWDNGQAGSVGVLTLSGGCNISEDGVLPGGLNVDPQFQTQPRGSYRLGPTSPAVDACPTGRGDDLDGNVRPVLLDGIQPYDMGAFERQAVPTAVTLSGARVASGSGLPLLLAALAAGTLTLRMTLGGARRPE